MSHRAVRPLQADFRVSDLLHYSAVCGCGLDTVPVQGRLGNAEEDAAQTRAIAATLLDMHAIAFRCAQIDRLYCAVAIVLNVSRLLEPAAR